MPTRIPALLHPPIGFAHRGARAHADENTLEGFELAVRLGADGLESDAWLTRDGEVVLHHDRAVRRRLAKRLIREVDRAELPPHIPTLGELYERVGTDRPISLDIKDPDAVGPVLEVARAHGERATANLWLCHTDLETVTSWRELDPLVRLVDSTRLSRIREGPERRAADLAARGVDAINLPFRDWSGGLTTLFHRFDRYAFAWDVQFEHALADVLDMGVDAVYSDWVNRMRAAIDAAAR